MSSLSLLSLRSVAATTSATRRQAATARGQSRGAQRSLPASARPRTARVRLRACAATPAASDDTPKPRDGAELASSSDLPDREWALPDPQKGAARGVGDGQDKAGAAVLEEASMGSGDLDYLRALMSIQEGGPRKVGFFGTRNMGYHHQQLVEMLSYALVSTGNHIFTSGATGTDAAVIRGALRAEKPKLLTVVLPQSMGKQPAENRELLEEVYEVISMPQNDEMALSDASRICNMDIVSRVEQVISFMFHDSSLLKETCDEAREENKVVTSFFLD